MDKEILISKLLEEGAFKACAVTQDRLVFSKEFRTICERNQCGVYGRCWACPPDCGEIDALMAKAASFENGILYQTVGELEDSFDIEGMQATKEKHAGISRSLSRLLREKYPGASYMHLGVGGCGLCERCAKRDNEPCRHPQDMLIPLEACGIDVYNTTKDTDLKYINGQNTVTYFGLLLY